MVYYEPISVTPEELELMARFDRFHFEHPMFGSRRMGVTFQEVDEHDD